MTHNLNQMKEINKFIQAHKLSSLNNQNLRFEFEATIVYKGSIGSDEEFYNSRSLSIVKETNEYTVNIFDLPTHIFSQYDSKYQNFKFGKNKDLKITDNNKSYQIQIIV